MTERGSSKGFTTSRAPTTDTQIDLRSAPLEAIPFQGSAPPSSDLGPAAAAIVPPRYEVLEEIHRGGMGEILLGQLTTPSGFSRRVVLKGLLSRLAADNVSHALFMREAHLMARLDHPNIVRVFDLPLLDGRPYLAMEHVRGRNLHQIIHRSGVHGAGVPPLIALTVVSEALRGLHSAHCVMGDDGEPLGLVHRDVSPGNILLSFFGEVKVTDFGIAKLADSPQYTGPRSIRGKARYVAPEQVHGRPATVGSDVYSAAVVLAEALMGAPLWERSTVPETLMAIVTEDRSEVLDRVLRGLPRVVGLRAALRRALSIEPANRPASALHFAEILESVAAGLGRRPTSVDLGLYLRTLFEGDEDVPTSDGFGASGHPATALAEPLDDDETAAATMEPTVPAPEDLARIAAGFATTPVAEDSAVFCNPAEPAVPVGLGPYGPGPDESDPEGPSEPAGPTRRGPRPEPEPRDLARSADVSVVTISTPNAGLGPLVTGIFIGASLAIAGCLLALAW